MNKDNILKVLFILIKNKNNYLTHDDINKELGFIKYNRKTIGTIINKLIENNHDLIELFGIKVEKKKRKGTRIVDVK